ncbi:fasciclin domain-containing protein [Cellulomonas marina]|uniref:Uncaracterized surface protein containing fasciclin (FAS1) repeats n=1 Tax=Cellulomonas marina TaxID=988821 RepID=A0A1I0YCZ1_9CELL|nr:fasciclin domain-containing protein [Cellulomonas marina]GIG28768.1 cell surface glycolipoprotein MPT83 [Cellulomonas marina]SFB11245.1 Uncaracterized surface protein containing fasciclin (FAS1) repeats [Cellulomonas marina]
MRTTTRTRLAAAFLLASGLTLTACSSSDTAEAGAAASSAAEDVTGSEGTGDDMASESAAPSPSEEEDMTTADPAAMLVGPGCADYAAMVPEGAGSVEGMSADPVATAASNNPLLKTLVQAVSGQLNSEVNLVDTLNGGEFTVFAPVDDAFAKIDPATIESLKTDAATLSSILTYHVVEGQVAPDEIVGDHATVQGGTVTVSGEGDALKVNDANVICGGVQTANATVYLIDSVLMPTM